MKRFAILFSGFVLVIITYQAASAQTKKPAKSDLINAQIKPEFSQMVDYVFPARTGVHELPGGKAPESNQINPDGSVKVNRTGEITVPAETDNFMQTPKKNAVKKERKGKKFIK